MAHWVYCISVSIIPVFYPCSSFSIQDYFENMQSMCCTIQSYFYRHQKINTTNNQGLSLLHGIIPLGNCQQVMKIKTFTDKRDMCKIETLVIFRHNRFNTRISSFQTNCNRGLLLVTDKRKTWKILVFTVLSSKIEHFGLDP